MSADGETIVGLTSDNSNKSGDSTVRYRAQVRSNDGSAWCDGAVFVKRKNAEIEAERLSDLFGNEVRIIECPDPLAALL